MQGILKWALPLRLAMWTRNILRLILKKAFGKLSREAMKILCWADVYINSRAYVARFNFSGHDQGKKCGVLSGGERNRLHLALTLLSEANVLLLDEPTNDIDVNTLRALEEALEDFAGCAVVISHDRWFLDRICTHIFAFEGEWGGIFL